MLSYWFQLCVTMQRGHKLLLVRCSRPATTPSFRQSDAAPASQPSRQRPAKQKLAAIRDGVIHVVAQVLQVVCDAGAEAQVAEAVVAGGVLAGRVAAPDDRRPARKVDLPHLPRRAQQQNSCTMARRTRARLPIPRRLAHQPRSGFSYHGMAKAGRPGRKKEDASQHPGLQVPKVRFGQVPWA
jgi:hypothetical protein